MYSHSRTSSSTTGQSSSFPYHLHSRTSATPGSHLHVRQNPPPPSHSSISQSGVVDGSLFTSSNTGRQNVGSSSSSNSSIGRLSNAPPPVSRLSTRTVDNHMPKTSSASHSTGRFSTSADQDGLSHSTSGADRPNWGLIGRQLSQIAGDVSTSVRQNELVITLLERLVERVEAANLARPFSPEVQSERSQRRKDVIYDYGDGNGSVATASSLPAHRRTDASYEREHDNRIGSQLASTNTIMSSQGQDEMMTFNGPPSGHSISRDNNTESHTYVPASSSSSTHAQQSRSTDSANTMHRYVAEASQKKTPPTIPFMLGEEAGHNASSVPDSAYDSASSRQQQHRRYISNGPGHSESYDGNMNPIFADDMMSNDEQPPSGLGLTPYYEAPTRSDRPDERLLRRSDQQTPQVSSTSSFSAVDGGSGARRTSLTATSKPPVDSGNERDSHARAVRTASGMGLLEDAGLVPIPSRSVVSFTAPSHELDTVDSGADRTDNPDASTSAYAFREDYSGDDWKLWLEPKQSNRKDVPRAKYRTAKQVKLDRHAKTKRSLSTIGRIPLKEYLEVGEEYKSVRRAARTVYNSWLELNVRLAKQDPQRLLACYHRLEYEFPILADCEEHWKAKELMLQVIDNAIDELSYYRRRDERKAKKVPNRDESGGKEANDASAQAVTPRRVVSAADLSRSEDAQQRPSQRRRLNDRVNHSSQSRTADNLANILYTNQFPDGSTGGVQQQPQNWATSNNDDANFFVQANVFTDAASEPPPSHKAAQQSHHRQPKSPSQSQHLQRQHPQPTPPTTPRTRRTAQMVSGGAW